MNNDDPRFTLGMMTKFWEPGRVKTRLGRSIGMRQAAELHRQFTLHLCDHLCGAADRRDLCVAPDNRIGGVVNELTDSSGHAHWSVVAQGPGDLGDRMARWLSRQMPPAAPEVAERSGRGPGAAAASRWRAIMIGADLPTIDRDDVQHAFDLLDNHDVVLGPARDGGYYLIGLRGHWDKRQAGLFSEIYWSTDSVYQTTRERALEAGLSVAGLPVRRDVDTAEDLAALIDQLARSSRSSDRVLLERINAILPATTATELANREQEREVS